MSLTNPLKRWNRIRERRGGGPRPPGRFRRFAMWTAKWMGSPWAFVFAVLVCVGWGASGPLFHYSDTWQLVINTITSLVTFVMVFVIQYSQNRDTTAMQLKLDELIRTAEGARTGLVRLEDLSDEEIERLQEQFRRLRNRRVGAVPESSGDGGGNGDAG